MNQVTRRDMLQSMAALAAGTVVLPSFAADIPAEPPPETSILFPLNLLPNRVAYSRQILNLRYVTTSISLYVDNIEGPPTAQLPLQIWASMSTRHRKGFGIPLELTGVQVTVNRTKWKTQLTSDPAWNSVGNIFGHAADGPLTAAGTLAMVTLEYKVKGRKKSLVMKNVEIGAPFFILR